MQTNVLNIKNRVVYIDDRLADWHSHISIEHNRREDWKGLFMIKHQLQRTLKLKSHRIV